MIHRRFVLTSARTEPIRGDLRYLESSKKLPVVVVCHGFKGFKDWGFHPYLGTRLAEAGFAALHFNFSRNGVGEDLLEFTEPEKFRRNTPSIELQDLETVLSAVKTEFPDDPLDLERIGLVGHSRGGGVAILGAARNPEVKALVTLAAISTFDRFRDPEILDLWRMQGYIEIPNARTGQVMPLGTESLDDFLENREKLDILAAVSRLRIPVKIIHGTADESVLFAEAEAIRDAGAPRVELVALAGAGHTFGAAHPWTGTTEHLELAIGALGSGLASLL